MDLPLVEGLFMEIHDSFKESAESHAKVVRDAATAHAVVLRDAAAAQARVVMSDIWLAIRTDRQVQFMLALLIFSLICFLFYGYYKSKFLL